MGYKEAIRNGRMLNYVEVVNLLAGSNDLKYTIPEALSIMMRDNKLHTRSEILGMIDGIVIDDGVSLQVVMVPLNGDLLMDKLMDLAKKLYYDGISVGDGTTPMTNGIYLYIVLM